jgi:hypothetical protein
MPMNALFLPRARAVEQLRPGADAGAVAHGYFGIGPKASSPPILLTIL